MNDAHSRGVSKKKEGARARLGPGRGAQLLEEYELRRRRYITTAAWGSSRRSQGVRSLTIFAEQRRRVASECHHGQQRVDGDSMVAVKRLCLTGSRPHIARIDRCRSTGIPPQDCEADQTLCGPN